ncbi:MAG: endonuclease [Prevotellaceae bacterium]|nr:endonuclease [Prevotellaceae bacterium]
MKKTIYIIALAIGLIATTQTALAQGPNGSGTYYRAANGTQGQALKTALYNIIKEPNVKAYSSLNDYYEKTDARADGKLWDMYSNITNYTFNKTGGNSSEGAGWNKEHSVPQSWFGEASPMKSDIVHVIPTDAFVNNMRSNYPFGETSNPTKTSANGFSKLGKCTTPGYSGTVFEPNDEYKGDFARIYFYMATCYENRMSSFTQSAGSNCFDGSKYPCFKSWFITMLLRWAEQDPVSQKEIDRNNAAAKIQGNRNPFVDYPKLEQYIWGSSQNKTFSYDNYGGVDPIYLPDIPTAIAATNITSNSFTANWIDSDNSETYTIELRMTQNNVTEDHTVMTETFAKCDGSGSTASTDCDKFMDNEGWTGSGLFPDNGKLRMASGKASSTLTSPLLSNPDGHVIVKFKESVYSKDATTITVKLIDKNGTDIQSKAVTADGSLHTIEFSNIQTDYKISFTSPSGQRYYMESIEIIAGGGAASQTKTLEGIEGCEYTFNELSADYTYSYKVKGVNKDGESDWSNSIEVTLQTSGLAGDSNEDGLVDVSDITTTASYILGQTPAKFNFSNADVDKDNEITVADITGTAGIILGK